VITIDTSAFIAVLRGEADSDAYLVALNAAEAVQLSAATYVETGIVVDNTKDPVISGRFDQLLAELDAEIRDVTARQARLARLIRQPGTDLVALDGRDATAVGLLLAQTATADIVDAHVVVCARRTGQAVVTSDAADLRRIAPELLLVTI